MEKNCQYKYTTNKLHFDYKCTGIRYGANNLFDLTRTEKDFDDSVLPSAMYK